MAGNLNTLQSRPPLPMQLRGVKSKDRDIDRLLKLAASRIETLEGQLNFFGGADAPTKETTHDGT